MKASWSQSFSLARRQMWLPASSPVPRRAERSRERRLQRAHAIRRRVQLPLLVGLLVSLAGIGWDRARQPEEVKIAVVPTVLAFFGPDFQLLRNGSFGLSDLRLLAREAGSADALRVTYPRGSTSASAARSGLATRGGAQMYLPLREGGAERARMRYLMRFPAEFQFARGGMLPGLYGGVATSGSSRNGQSDGFSTRLRWSAEGRGEVYAYSATNPATEATLARENWTWPVGRWICVEQEVVLNGVGRADGQLRVSVNGSSVLDAKALTLRGSESVMIEGIFFSTFFGGSDASYASPSDQHLDFAEFEMGSDVRGCASGVSKRRGKFAPNESA